VWKTVSPTSIHANFHGRCLDTGAFFVGLAAVSCDWIRSDQPMSFDQLPYRKIPIGENRHRVKTLNQFRDLLRQFIQPLGPDAVFVKDHIKEELERLINQATPVASRFIRLAGLSTSVPDSKREYLSNRSKAAGIDAKLDLLDGFLWQETPGLQRQAVALVDQAIGIYNGNESRAWSNTRNPFFWITRLIEWIADWIVQLIAWIAQLPVRIFSSIFGIDQEKAVRSKGGRFAISVSVFLQGLAALVYLLDRFGLLRWLGLK